MTDRAGGTRRTVITASALAEPTASLSGYTIGVTADRRRDELAGLLESRGARVVLAPALPPRGRTPARDATRHRAGQPRYRDARLARGRRGLGTVRPAACRAVPR